MRTKKTFLTVGTVVGVFALGVFALAFGFFAGTVGASAPNQTETPGSGAAPDRPHPVRVIGRVEQVGERGVILSVRGGMTLTVRVSDNTWIVVEQDGNCVEGTLRGVQTGSPAMVSGMTTNERGVINARVVAQCRGDLGGSKLPPAMGGRVPGQVQGKVRELGKHFDAGTIKSIDGSTLVITSKRRGDVTVTTTADTLVLNNGFSSMSSLKVGDVVQIFGKPDKSASPPADGKRAIAAWALRVDNGKDALMVGKVESVDGNSVVLRTREHKDGLQVSFAANAGFKSMSVVGRQVSIASATQADVKAGSNLLVDGTLSADGKSYTANAVIILPQVRR